MPTKTTGQGLATAQAADSAAPMSTAGGDQTAAGNAALANIMNSDDSTLKSSIDTFLGPIASQLDLTSDLPVLNAIGAQLASTSTSSSSTATAGAPTTAPAPAAGATATGATGAAAPAAKTPKTLEQDLESQILGRAEGLVQLLPDGATIDAKLKAIGTADPIAVYAALIAAAVAQHKLGLKSTLSHKFALTKNISLTPTVGLGGAGQGYISSLGASAEYDINANTSVTAGVSHAFASTQTTAGKTTALPANTTESLEIDGKELHGLIQSYTLKASHESFDAPKPNTDAIMGAVQLAVSQVPGLTLKFQDTETWAAAPSVKGVTETSSSPRNADNAFQGTISDKVNLLGMQGLTLSGTGTLNTGKDHKQSTVGGSVTFPEFKGVTVTVGDTTALGAGTAGSTQSIQFKLKSGIEFTIAHSDATTPASVTGEDAADFSQPVGRGVSVGIGFKLAF